MSPMYVGGSQPDQVGAYAHNDHEPAEGCEMYTEERLAHTIEEIETASQEMENRYAALCDGQVDDNGAFTPRVVVIDDYAAFVSQMRSADRVRAKDVERKIGCLARLGRSARIRVVLGTPDVADLSGELRDNLTHRYRLLATPPV